jgi:hypothetical protein
VKLYVIETHDQLLDVWRQQEARGLEVVHVDFHCDMRGMMIDRREQLAYRIHDVRQGVDQGNFLRHAIFDGIVSRVVWVHGSPGGRKCDVGCVKYTTDATALPQRWLVAAARRRPIPFGYRVETMTEWSGLEAGQFLDVDWDVFAANEMKRDDIEERVEEFFAKDLSSPPVGLAVCYSPHHSHDTRDEYRAFVARLESLYDADVVQVPKSTRPKNLPWRRRVIPRGCYAVLQAAYYRTVLALKHAGIE